MKWIALQFYRFLWSIWRVRLGDLYVTREGETRSRSDERLITRARKAIQLGGRQLAFRLCQRHSMPAHAFRWVMRETDEVLLKQSRTAWTAHQLEQQHRASNRAVGIHPESDLETTEPTDRQPLRAG